MVVKRQVFTPIENISYVGEFRFYLKVSKIMVKRTNLPRRGTTREVGGMISANRRKNTVSESRMEMERLTWRHQKLCYALTTNIIFN